ncbi:MAG TPA: sulfite exporter TauE/SafE family protein [Flavobacteriales bacterium]|nr:sulfite exporter TauE/SafE family protein [Flavobacteriales bacterium]
MEIIGYFGAIIVGVLVALVGAGGSILTVPILVYLFGIAPVTATGYSLLIIGITSFISTTGYMYRKLINYRIVVLFGIPSVIMVYITRKFLVPLIPETIFEQGQLLITKDSFLMLMLGVLIMISAISMISVKKNYKTDEAPRKVSNFQYSRMILIEGLIIGTLTGFVGTGGGFMIIPALVILCQIPIKIAVGSALLIAAFKSGIGFLGEIGNNPNIDYEFMGIFTGLALIGIIIGSLLSHRVSGYRLRNAFGYFIMVIAVFILIRTCLDLF